MVERGIGVTDDVVTGVVLEEDAVRVGRGLVLLVEVTIYLCLYAFVGGFKVDIELLVVWVLLELSHRFVQLINPLAHLHDLIYLGNELLEVPFHSIVHIT